MKKRVFCGRCKNTGVYLILDKDFCTQDITFSRDVAKLRTERMERNKHPFGPFKIRKAKISLA